MGYKAGGFAFVDIYINPLHLFFFNTLCEYVPLVDPGRSWKGSLMRFPSDLSF